jgi:hypothetical protein
MAYALIVLAIVWVLQDGIFKRMYGLLKQIPSWSHDQVLDLIFQFFKRGVILVYSECESRL